MIVAWPLRRLQLPQRVRADDRRKGGAVTPSKRRQRLQAGEEVFAGECLQRGFQAFFGVDRG